MRLPRCVLVVLRLMCSSSAISTFVRPRATVSSTSSSRTVSGTTVVIADYITTANGNAFTYTPNSASTRALLHVDFYVNINPNEGWKTWRLVDDIVLRNTLRQ